MCTKFQLCRTGNALHDHDVDDHPANDVSEYCSVSLERCAGHGHTPCGLNGVTKKIKYGIYHCAFEQLARMSKKAWTSVYP